MKKIRQLRESNAGISMLELIVAVAMLAIIMTPFMRSFLVALNVSQSSKDYSAVTSTIGNVIEAVKNASSANMSSDLESSYGTLVESLSNQSFDIYSDATDSSSTKISVVGDRYFYQTGSVADGTAQTIMVENFDPVDAYSTMLNDLNASELSTYTNMDLTLIHQGEDVNNITTTGINLVDVDVWAYYKLKNMVADCSSITSGPDYSKLERTITINLEATASNGTDYDGMKYTIEYAYRLPIDAVYYGNTITELKESKIYFTGSVGSGADDLIAMQFVYLPLNVQQGGTLSDDADKIIVKYDDPPADLDVRLFLIKQVRDYHSVFCYTATPSRYGQLSAACNYCASDSYEKSNFSSVIHLQQSSSGTELTSPTIDIMTNIGENVYSEETGLTAGAVQFKFNSSAAVDVNDLVYEAIEGGRISIVRVTIFEGVYTAPTNATDPYGDTSKILSSIDTVKLN